MSVSLLTTKFYFPAARANLVPRPQLIERLVRGLGGPLTLISAPAGYGKTTLLSEWRAGVGRDIPAAWLSLDAGENDPARLLLYTATTLDALQPGVAGNILPLLQSSQTSSPESPLTSLINDLSGFPRDFVLVLDDVHLLTAQEVYTALTYLIEHLPANMHLVLLSRADPPLPLARLRARGQLTEIRAEHLRFSMDESAQFLSRVMGLTLTSEQIAALEERTEGWVAGLQLAAIAMQSALSVQGGKDIQRFISAFTGSHHYIVDYLVEEVLNSQPQELRDFLLKTSLLNRMNGALCDVLTESSDGQSLLERLEHANLFVIPLDEVQRWYRYHHLFTDVLRKRFRQAFPEIVPELYRRAAQWCEQNDLLEEAIEYALAAQDFPLAVRLIEFSSWRLVTRSSISVILRWMRALPQGLILSRLRLCFHCAQALIDQGSYAEAEIFLQTIENALHENSFAQSDAARELTENVDPLLMQAAGGLKLVERLPILVNLLRCNMMLLQENSDAAQVYCDQALQQIPSSDLLDHCVAQWFSGSIAFTNGDHSRAAQCLGQAVRESRIVGHHSAYVGANSLLGLQSILEGKLHQALSYFTESARYAQEQPEPIPPEIETVRIADIQREWNNLQEATATLQGLDRLAEDTRDFTFQRECYVTKARLEQAHGNIESALDALQKAENVARNTQTWRGISPIKPMQARLWITIGNLEAAGQWANVMGITPDSALHFQDEYSLLTLARLLLAQGCSAEASHLLRRLRSFSALAGRQGRVIEIIMLQALARQAAGKHDLAAETLTEALRIAYPEGYIRMFVDEGEPMRSLIARSVSRIAKNDPQLQAYTHKLLSAFPLLASKAGTLEIQTLIDPLSERELEVLRLIATGCSNKEIAQELFVAIGTVKRHTANIFQKLDVRNRTEAVRRARELQLL